jgi:hypothetical protein
MQNVFDNNDTNSQAPGVYSPGGSRLDVGQLTVDF